MRIFHRWWRGDPEGLERAKQAEAEAAERLEEVRAQWPESLEAGDWARETLAVNRLTERFLSGLGHGGRPL